MGRAGRLHRRYTRLATILFAGMGVASAILWVLVSDAAPGSPVVELPQVATVTFLLGAVSLFVTSRAGAVVQGRTRERDRSVRWPSIVTTYGERSVTLSVLLSLFLLTNGALYFALDGAWPITPSGAGLLQFYLLAVVVLVPVAISMLAVASLAFARVLPS